MEDKYVIGEKEYTREELLIFGKQHYPKFYWIYRGVGIGLMFIGVFIALIYVAIAIGMKPMDEDGVVSSTFYAITIPFFIMALVGGIFFAVSFKKEPDENTSIDFEIK